MQSALSPPSHTWAVPLPLRGQQQLCSTRSSSALHATKAKRAAPVGLDTPSIQVALPGADFTRVKKAEFITSSATVEACPPGKYPEFAVIGRSNVGKSSLVNMLTNNDKLAKVSKEPGLTKLINHFLINDSWYLVDLPGYGFAKAGKQQKVQWFESTQQYFLQRDNLVNVLLLVDSSLPPQYVDIDCANWLGEAQVPFTLVFTKTDNSKRSGPSTRQNMNAFKRELLEDWEALPPCFETSSRTGGGRTELLQYIAGLRQLYLQSEQ